MRNKLRKQSFEKTVDDSTKKPQTQVTQTKVVKPTKIFYKHQEEESKNNFDEQIIYEDDTMYKIKVEKEIPKDESFNYDLAITNQKKENVYIEKR